MEWIIILVQIFFTILLYLFVRYNYKKIDNWLMVIIGLISLAPILGGVAVFAVWIIILYSMSDEYKLSDTKINRFLFKSKFGE